MTQGLKIQARLKERQEGFETDMKKENDDIRDLEETLEKTKAKIAAKEQILKNLARDFQTDVEEMKSDVDYFEDSAIRDMTAHLGRLTKSMETLKTVLNK